MKISADTAKCNGQAPNGTQVCGYRERCLRYVAQENQRQVWADFYKAGDDCVYYISLPRVEE